MTNYKIVEERVDVEESEEDYSETEIFPLGEEDELLSATAGYDYQGDGQYYVVKYLQYVEESQTENSETNEENKTVEQTVTAEPYVQ